MPNEPKKPNEALKREEPKREAPKQEALKQEAPKQEAPKQEALKQEAPKQEAPKQEALKQEAPKQEAPKQEAPKREEPKREERPTALPPAPIAEGGSPMRRFVDRYERYALKVQTIVSDSEKRVQEAAQKLLKETQDEQAQHRFLQEQQEAWTEAQRRYEEAYRQYLDSLRDCWSPGDITAMDASSLLTIGQSLQAAAALAQSTMGSWCMMGYWVTQPAVGFHRAA